MSGNLDNKQKIATLGEVYLTQLCLVNREEGHTFKTGNVWENGCQEILRCHMFLPILQN